jgi:hypothetical protein
MLKALLWKEWHEQRWRVALATVWLLGIATIGLKTRVLPDIAIVCLTWIPTAVILPAFVGMGLFASERKAGTLAYLVVQPISRGQVLAAKTIMGLLAYIIPMVACGAVVYLAVGGRELSRAELACGITGIVACGLVLFGWQLLAGLRCRWEETYVLVSAIVVGCWILHWFIVSDWDPDQRLGLWIAAMNPLTLLELGQRQAQKTWTLIAVQSPIAAGLGLGLWLRFHRLRESRP